MRDAPDRPRVHRDRGDYTDAVLWAEVGGWSVQRYGKLVAVPEDEAARLRASRAYRRHRDQVLAAGRARTLAVKVAAGPRTCQGCGAPIPPDRRADTTWCKRNCRRDAWRARRRAAGNAYT